jgi:glycosyltransferase involved in cell wall biosynthesis
MAQVEQVHPSQLEGMHRTGYDLYLFVDDGFPYPLPADLRPQAYWAIDTHIDFARERERATGADFVFAAQRNGAEQLSQALGRSVEWLPLACDPAIHARQDDSTSFNISFVGNLIGRERVRLVQLLKSKFPDVHIGRHFFEDMAAIYSASRLVFNRSVVDDINMRVFEALCSGSLLVTNDLSTNAQAELFQDGKHLVTYSGDEELLDKIRFYLRHDASRERIARAGRQEVLTSTRTDSGWSGYCTV